MCFGKINPFDLIRPKYGVFFRLITPSREGGGRGWSMRVDYELYLWMVVPQTWFVTIPNYTHAHSAHPEYLKGYKCLTIQTSKHSYLKG